MKVTVLLLALTSAITLAVDNAAAPQSAVNRQSAVNNRQSTIVNGPEAITIPQMLSYQGKLTDTLGVPVPDGNYALTFRLYTQPSGGSAVWTEAQTIPVKNGLFAALLGTVTPLASLPESGACYLSLQVALNPELSPRQRLVSAAYSYLAERSANSDLLQGNDTTALDVRYVNEGQANAVTGAMLVDGTVLTADVGDTVMTMAKLARAGATTGQVVKWTGSAWAPGADNTGGGSGVTDVYQDTGIICVPNPITSSGNVKLNVSYSDGRYMNTAGDSMTGALAEQGDLRVYGKGRIGPSNSNAGPGAFVVGQGNSAGGSYSSITGGEDNSVGGSHSHVGGGSENSADGDYVFVGGGNMNYATGLFGVAAGGRDNTATGHAATVAGGRANTAGDSLIDSCATVAGGYGNIATAKFAFVGGGRNDTASDVGATVAGGSYNRASGVLAMVGGGADNKASGTSSTVAGGQHNEVSDVGAFVGGGLYNLAVGYSSAVCGGYQGRTDGRYSGVLSGRDNRAGDAAGDTSAVVAGGYANFAIAAYATVGGGKNDTASGKWAFVGGGERNVASGGYAAVGCGHGNRASAWEATVAGGLGNVASGDDAAVGGGTGNSATGPFATVCGGSNNEATANGATIGGGADNVASGHGTMIPGGFYCLAAGYGSSAAGYRARARHAGSFVWSDSCNSVSDSVYTTGNNQWRVRARGGAWFYSNLAKTTGAYLAPGSNSWESACDSMTKEDFRAVDREALLEEVAALRVRDYKMKDQNDGTRHIGPVAQDFHKAFGYGGTETGINLADADGVLLAAVQALYEEVKTDNARIAQLEAELAQQKR
jgi:hypothetical protein